ncbi:DMT family transporter [Desulfobacula sp.]|uniref:DMT family transporter n=1 Tax=Desulfobacula sp. TaxID=2593537 RepID=UPI002629258B|nr:DMT family transporter [Desulfobacula sp.]
MPWPKKPTGIKYLPRKPFKDLTMTSKNEFSAVTTTAIVLLCIIFGANPVAVKITLAGLGSFTNAGIRFAIAAVVILLWALLSRQPLKIQKHLWGSTLTLGMILATQMSLFYIGMTKTNASHGALITNLLPFLVLVLSHFFIPGDRITPRKVVGMLMGFSGVFLILMDKEGMGSGYQTGDLIVLAAVFVWACRIIFTKKVIQDFEPFHLVLYPFLLAAPLLLACGVLLDPAMVIRLDRTIIWALLYQSIAIASLGFVAWNTLLKQYGAASLHSFVFLMPIAGVCFGWLILGEPVTSHLLAALALVTTGLMVLHLKLPGFP